MNGDRQGTSNSNRIESRERSYSASKCRLQISEQLATSIYRTRTSSAEGVGRWGAQLTRAVAAAARQPILRTRRESAQLFGAPCLASYFL